MLDSLDPQVHGPEAVPRLPPNVQFHRGDVRDRAACAEALDGVDAVVHCAAAVGVAQSLYRVEHYVDVNVRGTATLLECLAEPLYIAPAVFAPLGVLAIGRLIRRDTRSGGWRLVGLLGLALLALTPVAAGFLAVRRLTPHLDHHSCSASLARPTCRRPRSP